MLTELESIIVLNSVPGLGQGGIKQLIDRFGTAGKVLSASEKTIARERIVSPQVAEHIIKFNSSRYLKEEMRLIKKHEVDLISLSDSGYPQALKEIPGAPLLLYVKGQIPANVDLSIAIVGSRKASSYGLTHSRQFAMRLADLGFCVVSGLARGVDTSAHQGVLKANGTTIAVLGSGLANVYPKENIRLFEHIAETGCVISEFAMTIPPFAHNFPRRNRIISGLSLGVVVIEAARRSGALITCDFALEQGRDVFAVPGTIGHPNSQGVNDLIKQGAKLVMDVEDVVDEYASYLSQMSENLIDQAGTRRQTEDHTVLSVLGENPIHIDHLANVLQWPAARVSAELLKLELNGTIKQLPGKLFIRSN